MIGMDLDEIARSFGVDLDGYDDDLTREDWMVDNEYDIKNEEEEVE